MIFKIPKDKLVFGQQTHSTIQYFKTKYGQAHKISVEQFPHYQLFTDPKSNDYKEYISYSWEIDINDKLIKAQNDYALELFEHIKSSNRLNYDPIAVVKRLDGLYSVVDGNHRVCAEVALGALELDCEEISTEDYLTCWFKENKNPFRITENGPYQQIEVDGQIVLKGRRNITNRLSYIKESDIKDKKVIDVGCNIGVQAYEIDKLASETYALEYDRDLCICGARLGNFYNRTINFIHKDITKENLDLKVDTVCCFSVFAHIKKYRKVFIERLLKLGDVFYIECHQNENINDYKDLTSKFHTVEVVKSDVRVIFRLSDKK